MNVTLGTRLWSHHITVFRNTIIAPRIVCVEHDYGIPRRGYWVMHITMVFHCYGHGMMHTTEVYLWEVRASYDMVPLWPMRVAHDYGISIWTLCDAHDDDSTISSLHESQLRLHLATESHISRLVKCTRRVAKHCDPVGDVKLKVVNDHITAHVWHFDLETLRVPCIACLRHTERYARLRQADCVERDFNLAAKENTRSL